MSLSRVSIKSGFTSFVMGTKKGCISHSFIMKFGSCVWVLTNRMWVELVGASLWGWWETLSMIFPSLLFPTTKNNGRVMPQCKRNLDIWVTLNIELSVRQSDPNWTKIHAGCKFQQYQVFEIWGVFFVSVRVNYPVENSSHHSFTFSVHHFLNIYPILFFYLNNYPLTLYQCACLLFVSLFSRRIHEGIMFVICHVSGEKEFPLPFQGL